MLPYVAGQVEISKALSIGGWMSEKELTWLATMVKNCKNIVEFGSLLGRSTRALADNAINGARIWAVDPWNVEMIAEDGQPLHQVNTYVMPAFLFNLDDHIKVGRVIPVRMFSQGFNLDIPVDMVFLDGDHRYKAVVKDIKKALSLLCEGGLICGHDYEHPTWPGVKQAVDELLKDVQIEDTIWWTQKC